MATHLRTPEAYPRRVLLAVTGLTPQVVTETLYGLAVARDRAFVPTEILLITTLKGEVNARLSLLSEDPGWFHRGGERIGKLPPRDDHRCGQPLSHSGRLFPSSVCGEWKSHLIWASGGRAMARRGRLCRTASSAAPSPPTCQCRRRPDTSL
jgi:hypothetical protein